MEATLSELYRAIEAKDGERVERTLDESFRSGLSQEYVPALIDLLGKPWHSRHEDVVSALQELKDPRAVDALYEEASASYEYLNYNEFFGLARKCTWALADIGTAEARAKLQALAEKSNAVVAGYARKRLERWEEERHRKGAPNNGMHPTRIN